MSTKISGSKYAAMYGPTTGDKVRLADTSLVIEVEKDYTTYGDEVKFGGGKTIRDGMGQSVKTCSKDGALARMAEKYDSTILIEKDGTAVNLEKLLAVMKLNIQYQETVKVTIEGSDEAAALEQIQTFFEENL